MTTTINASTSSGLVVTPDNSGNVLLQYNGQSAPCFSAYLSGSQTVSSVTWTKVLWDIELFDTNNNFSSGRFTPTVAGYYQINGSLWTIPAVSTAIVSIYKNGTLYVYGTRTDTSSACYSSTVNQIVYCNGTTDYVEIYGYTSGTVFYGTNNFSMFSGCLLRGA